MSTDVIVYEKKSTLTRIALLANGDLQELEFIKDNQAAEGNIYLGKITHKLDLAQEKVGFFVDITDNREAFLNAEEAGMNEANMTEGQSIVVQVAQEQRAEKGAKVVRSIQIVGTHLVYCPFRMTIEASPRIEDRSLLSEYKEKVMENTTGQEGWILRTSSVDVPFEVIAAEMVELRNAYEGVRVKARSAKAPSLLYTKSNPLHEHISRTKSGLCKIVVNSHHLENDLKETFGEGLDIEYMAEPFDEYGLEEGISDALQKTVYLKSGGRICIEETKAFVAIDVDSGDDKANGSISRLNSEAAVEIARQIRLRNLSGKIIIDFAGSSEYKFLKSVIEELEILLADDPCKARVLGLSRGGNVEIQRIRRRPTLSDVLTTECESCQGTGRVAK